MMTEVPPGKTPEEVRRALAEQIGSGRLAGRRSTGVRTRNRCRRIEVDDLFAVDLVASLSRASDEQVASVLADLLDMPVHSPATEPAAARLGALTTPGARDDAVVDFEAGTIDLVGGATGRSVVAAGAGELLTAAVAEMLGIPRAAADWVKRGPDARPGPGAGPDGGRPGR